MKFYNKYFKNNYEELLTYYPDFYKNVYEMNQILKAFGSISDDLETAIEQVFFNNFVLTADLETVKIWENILDITYSEKLTLDQRKRVIIGRISGYGHIGEPEIRNIISNYTENSVSIDFRKGKILVDIDGEIFDENNLLNTLLRRIPAHLALNMTLHIKRTFRQNLYFMQLGHAITKISGNPPDKKKFSGKISSSGGMFCRTYTKSKLIG